MRHVHQIRPKNDPSAAVYAPQRDVANIFLPMMREVFAGLDSRNWNPFFKQLFEARGITDQQLCLLVPKFLEAHRLFIRDRLVATPAEAFEKAGLCDEDDTVKYAFFCRLGEVVTGGLFVALRDVTMQGHESAVAADMAAMIAAGRELAYRLDGVSVTHTVSECEIARAEADERQRVIAQLQQQQQQDRHVMAPWVQLSNSFKASQWWSRPGLAVKTAWRLYKGGL